MTITRLALRNYKSIAACDLRMRPLSIFVGRNGAGKSNLLDALRFVSDSLKFSLDHAIRSRGGITGVRKRSRADLPRVRMALESEGVGLVREPAADGPPSVGFRIDFEAGGGSFSYAGQLATDGDRVAREACRVWAADGSTSWYEVRDGRVVAACPSHLPPVLPHGLYLVAASHLPQFRPVFEALSGMAFYSFSPDAIRTPPASTPEGVLRRDGSNLPEILRELAPEAAKDVNRYLSVIVSGVSVDTELADARTVLRFTQAAPDDDEEWGPVGVGVVHASGTRRLAWHFPANSMSDGTLRVLATLVAVHQTGALGQRPPGLVGIEEPETSLHPEEGETLMEILSGATPNVQVLLTTHSPDLLDSFDVDLDSIIPVAHHRGETIVGPLRAADRSIVTDKLFTVGELLRMGQLEPEREAAAKVNLFEGLP